MNYIPIAFIADYNFFLPTVVAITSLLESKNKSTDYMIYLINIGFLDTQRKMIEELSEKYSTPIKLVDIKDDYISKTYPFLNEHNCSASPAALLKFDLANLCAPEDCVLYLDGDIIVKGDLGELKSIALTDDKYVYAVHDTGALYSRNLIEQNIDNYFNSGVMLLNLKAIRQNDISRKLVEAKMNSQDVSLMDQNIFNKVFYENKGFLPHSFNVLYVNLIRATYFYGLKIEKVNEMTGTDYSDWNDMFEKAVIVHYSSFDKPWKYSDVTAVELWDKYFKLSPVSAEQLKRKKIHNDFINKLRKHKLTGLLGSFIWETETKGLRKALIDAKRYIIK